jgi:APA family basic amino acid/polyamine antiporter
MPTMVTGQQPGALRRQLGLLHVFCIASGAMISSGLFVLPGLAFAKAGPAIIVAYLLAGVLSLPGMLSIAEMATAMPKAGADCYTVIRSMGPGVGTVAGLLSWFSLSMKSAFALVGMAVFVTLLVPVDMHVVAVFCAGAFLLINIVGIREAGWLQVALSVGLLLLMVAYVVLGLPKVGIRRLEPFSPHGLPAAFFVTGYVFVSYGGLLKVASVAEEIRNPARNIPLGMLVSLLVVLGLYASMIFVTVGVLEPASLSGSLTPISDGAAAVMGAPGRIALSIAAVLAFLTTANAGIMTAARSLVPLSRDRLFPGIFARVSTRFGTPHNALLLTGGFVIASLFLNLELLVEAASVVLILTNVLACLSVVILRESGLENYRPRFRAPLYPWLQIVGLLGFGFILVEMGWEAYLITAVLSLAGLCTYWFYGREYVRRESALLHLVERITARELTGGMLEAELKQTIRERDEIVHDRFDALVEDCPVLDLEHSMAADDFFDTAAASLAEAAGMSPAALAQDLKAREAQGSTAINAWFAVPHAVIQGEGTFSILLSRCREGVAFSKEAPAVQAIFVLVGPLSERGFYLSALAAIAQVAGQDDFRRRWLAARRPQGLRDAVLLAERARGVATE